MPRILFETPHTEQAVRDALRRAAFFLNKEGMSGSDREQAAIVDSLHIVASDATRDKDTTDLFGEHT